MMANPLMASSWFTKERLTLSNTPNQAEATTTAMPNASNEMMIACFSAPSSAIRYAVARPSAISPDHRLVRASGPPRGIGSDPLTDFFPDQPGRAPGHDGDDDAEGEDILVGTGKRQHYSADCLQACE